MNPCCDRHMICFVIEHNLDDDWFDSSYRSELNSELLHGLCCLKFLININKNNNKWNNFMTSSGDHHRHGCFMSSKLPEQHNTMLGYKTMVTKAVCQTGSEETKKWHCGTCFYCCWLIPAALTDYCVSSRGVLHLQPAACLLSPLCLQAAKCWKFEAQCNNLFKNQWTPALLSVVVKQSWW